MTFNDYFTLVPYLQTERLIFRAFDYADMKSYINIIGNPQVRKYLAGGVNYFDQEPHITNWLNNINNRLLKSKKVLTWCIESKEDHQIVGRIDLGGFIQKTMADIAYYISPEFWGKGLATEAVTEITRFGFEKLKLHRIQATVLPDNSASIRVLEKCNFAQEGLLRKYSIGKEFHDTIMLSCININNIKNTIKME